MTDQQPTTKWSIERIVGVLRAMADEDDLPEHLKAVQISGQDTVETLGLDSLGAVYLIERLEAEAGVALPDDFLEFDDSVAVIAERINRLLRGEG